jgi:hypothetical protein
MASDQALLLFALDIARMRQGHKLEISSTHCGIARRYFFRLQYRKLYISFSTDIGAHQGLVDSINVLVVRPIV